MGQIPFHPAANIFPMLSKEQLSTLAADIKEHGPLNPIEIYEGQIIDGRNRYLACLEAKVKPQTTKIDLNGQTPMQYVVSQNLHRRHLDESQRAAVAARIATRIHGDQSDAQICASPTQEEAAELLNVSRRSVQQARTVIEEGSKDLVAALDAGEVAVSTAAKVAKLPKKKQRAAVKGGKKAIKEAIAEVAEEKEPEEEPTLAETISDENKQIESFCRGLVKHFEEKVPQLQWTKDSGRIGSALASVRAACATLRSAEAVECPACEEGSNGKGKCRHCKGHGYLPEHQEKAIPASERK